METRNLITRKCQKTLISSDDSILQLPDEVLRLILYQVPDHWNASQSCSRLYDVSCDIKHYNLKIKFEDLWSDVSVKRSVFNEDEKLKADNNCLNVNFLDDNVIFNSMIKSRRRITRSYVEGSFVHPKLNVFHLDRLLDVIDHFGFDITQLYLSSLDLSDEFVEILSLMPNLEKISLLYVTYIGKIETQELKLHKLNEIESMGSSKTILKVFDSLPPGVLRKVKLHQFESSTSIINDEIKLFENQFNIKEIHFNESFCQLLNFVPLKLTTLILTDRVELESIIREQNKLVNLSIAEANSRDMNLICSKLRALKTLKIVNTGGMTSSDFYNFSKMKNLNQLDIGWSQDIAEKINESLISFQNISLVDLKIHCCLPLSDEAIESLGKNAPMIKNLYLHTKSSFNVINAVIQHFKNLETLEFDNRYPDGQQEQFVHDDGLENYKLKKLTIKTTCSFNDFPKLVGCCKKLEEIDGFVVSNEEALRAVLANQVTLKSLKLRIDSWSSKWFPEISQEFISALKTHGKQLTHFQCVFGNYEDGMSLNLLQKEFRDQFSFIITQGCNDSCPLKSNTLMMTNSIEEIKASSLSLT